MQGTLSTHFDALPDGRAWFADNVVVVNRYAAYADETTGFLAHVPGGIVADLRRFTDRYRPPEVRAVRVQSSGAGLPQGVPSSDLRDAVSAGSAVVRQSVTLAAGGRRFSAPLSFYGYRPETVSIIAEGGEVPLLGCSGDAALARTRIRVFADGWDVTHLANVGTSVGSVGSTGEEAFKCLLDC